MNNNTGGKRLLKFGPNHPTVPLSAFNVEVQK